MIAAARARRGNAGFTLVELMVALTGGLFISLAVFALARDSGRFYQREARVANATVSALMGFERLRTDIGRAGYLSSPNINRDPSVCGSPNAAWPVNLRQVAAVQITQPAVAYPALTANGRTPASLLLAGSYASADVFSAYVLGIGATTVIALDPSQPALLRLGNGANPDSATLATVFAPGRALRIVEYGRSFFGQIAIAPTGGAAPTVTLNASPPFQLPSGNPCGLREVTSGSAKASVNVVNFIHYDIRNLSTAAQTAEGQNTYASLYANSAAGPGEAQRTELVRVEQDVTGLPVPNTEEVVAEYAVDLAFQFTAITTVTGLSDPNLELILASDARYNTYAGSSFLSTSRPDRMRSVRVRLGVRSREGDRANDVATGVTPNGVGLFRFNLGSGGAGTTDAYARVRTFQADVALRNQGDVIP